VPEKGFTITKPIFYIKLIFHPLKEGEGGAVDLSLFSRSTKLKLYAG
jgi:hypothetical protein